MRAGSIRALADAADALARLARSVAEDSETEDALISVRDAARLAATSTRTVRNAIRGGTLRAYGQTRNRAVRRGDLLTWIAERRSESVPGPENDDIDRRMRRLAREQGLLQGSSSRRQAPAGKP
jgi:hypothetical protein